MAAGQLSAQRVVTGLLLGAVSIAVVTAAIEGLRQAEEKTRRIAAEQAALRRVATLVARADPPNAVFAAVAEETGRLSAPTLPSWAAATRTTR